MIRFGRHNLSLCIKHDFCYNPVHTTWAPPCQVQLLRLETHCLRERFARMVNCERTKVQQHDLRFFCNHCVPPCVEPALFQIVKVQTATILCTVELCEKDHTYASLAKTHLCPIIEHETKGRVIISVLTLFHSPLTELHRSPLVIIVFSDRAGNFSVPV